MRARLGMVTIMIALSLANLSGVKANEPPQICDKALLQRNVVSTSLSKRAKLAWMRLVTESNYKDTRLAGSALVPGYFDGDYKQFDTKRNNYFNKEKYQSSHEEARNELRVEVPDGSVQAWIDCIKIQGEGLFSWIEHTDDVGASLMIQWKPPPGLGKLTNVEIKVDGVSPLNREELATKTQLLEGSTRFLLTRDPIKGQIRGHVNGQAGTGASPGSYSADIYVQAVLLPEERFDTKLCLIVYTSHDQDPSNKVKTMITDSTPEDCAVLSSRDGGTDVWLGCRDARGHDRFGTSRFAVLMPSQGEGEGRRDKKLTAGGPPFGPEPNCGW